MTTIAMRRSAVTAMTNRQRRLLRVVAERVELGDPVDYAAPGDVHWLVWDDDRVDLADLAAIATFARLLDDADKIDDDDTGEGRRARLRQWASKHWDPAHPPHGGEDPQQWVLARNKAPATLRVLPGVPDTWQPEA